MILLQAKDFKGLLENNGLGGIEHELHILGIGGTSKMEVQFLRRMALILELLFNETSRIIEGIVAWKSQWGTNLGSRGSKQLAVPPGFFPQKDRVC